MFAYLRFVSAVSMKKSSSNNITTTRTTTTATSQSLHGHHCLVSSACSWAEGRKGQWAFVFISTSQASRGERTREREREEYDVTGCWRDETHCTSTRARVCVFYLEKRWRRRWWARNLFFFTRSVGFLKMMIMTTTATAKAMKKAWLSQEHSQRRRSASSHMSTTKIAKLWETPVARHCHPLRTILLRSWGEDMKSWTREKIK